MASSNLDKMKIENILNPQENQVRGWTNVNGDSAREPTVAVNEPPHIAHSSAENSLVHANAENADKTKAASRARRNAKAAELQRRQTAALRTLFHTNQLGYDLSERLSGLTGRAREVERQRLARAAVHWCKAMGQEVIYNLTPIRARLFDRNENETSLAP